MDTDADGTFATEETPFSVVTGEAANDTNTPATRAVFKTVAEGQAEVTLTAKDGADGSGIAAIYYILDRGAPKLYAEPFTTPFGTAVKFFSVDKTGNTETPKMIIVDDAPDTLDTAEPLSEGAHIRRKIDSQGDEDWFSAANDTTYFIPLVERTAAHFGLGEVSADKAYLSKKNLNAVESVGSMPFVPFKSNNLEPTEAGMWARMYHLFMYEREAFMEHYHKRSNIEIAYSMIKGKFGSALRSKSDTGQTNKALCKVLAHNICVLIQAMHTFNIHPIFSSESRPEPKIAT